MGKVQFSGVAVSGLPSVQALNDWLKQNFLKGPNCQLVLAYCVLCHQIRAACGLLPNILSRSSSPK